MWPLQRGVGCAAAMPALALAGRCRSGELCNQGKAAAPSSLRLLAVQSDLEGAIGCLGHCGTGWWRRWGVATSARHRGDHRASTTSGCRGQRCDGCSDAVAMLLLPALRRYGGQWPASRCSCERGLNTCAGASGHCAHARSLTAAASTRTTPADNNHSSPCRPTRRRAAAADNATTSHSHTLSLRQRHRRIVPHPRPTAVIVIVVIGHLTAAPHRQLPHTVDGAQRRDGRQRGERGQARRPRTQRRARNGRGAAHHPPRTAAAGRRALSRGQRQCQRYDWQWRYRCCAVAATAAAGAAGGGPWQWPTTPATASAAGSPR